MISRAGLFYRRCRMRLLQQPFRPGRGLGACRPRRATAPCVPDNAATHKPRLVHDRLLKRPRWHLHFTPISLSWLNLVEGWFSLLIQGGLQYGAFGSADAPEAAIQAYIDLTHAERKSFIWTKTADDILASVGRFCQRISHLDN